MFHAVTRLANRVLTPIASVMAAAESARIAEKTYANGHADALTMLIDPTEGFANRQFARQARADMQDRRAAGCVTRLCSSAWSNADNRKGALLHYLLNATTVDLKAKRATHATTLLKGYIDSAVPTASIVSKNIAERCYYHDLSEILMGLGCPFELNITDESFTIGAIYGLEPSAA